MMIRKLYKLSLLMFVGILIHACVEPYEFEAETFENALVVDGRISNEFKRHRVSLTKTFRFEEGGAAAERNARVSVISSQQQEYLFEETEPGIYLSQEEFSAVPNTTYQLQIITTGGDIYESEPEVLTRESQIEELTAVRVNNSQGETGIALQVYSNEILGAAAYFRYEYKEDFEIMSPMSSIYDLAVDDDEVILIPKENEEVTCYGEEGSIDINLVNTASFSQNRVSGHVVKFLHKDDPKIAQRYSMLVKQYVISQQAYTYYNTLKELSQSENLFSQNQPGFLNGNIYSISNPEESVIGFFNVASETSKRVFFSFTDFFDPSEGGVYFPQNCNITRPEIPRLIQLIEEGSIKLLESIEAPAGPDAEGSGPYRVVPRRCIDCTVYGTNEVPDFWEE